MEVQKGSIYLAAEPAKIYRWFNDDGNWNKEIEAFGIGDIENGVVVINNWLFPKQEVTSASVSIKPEKGHYEELFYKGKFRKFKDIPRDVWDKIICVWHKHPGGTSPSGTDLKETFRAFTGLKICSYIISAMKSYGSGGIDASGWIDIREPIECCIDAEVYLLESDKVDKVCDKIIKSCIVEDETITKTAKDSNVIVVGNKTTQTSINCGNNMYELKSILDLDIYRTNSTFKLIFDEAGMEHVLKKLKEWKGLVEKYELSISKACDNTKVLLLVPAKGMWKKLRKTLQKYSVSYTKYMEQMYEDAGED